MEGWAALRDTIVNSQFEKFEKLLGDKKWFCGDEVKSTMTRLNLLFFSISKSFSSIFKLTWADLCVGEFAERCDSCFEKGYISKFPKIQQHMKRVHELPKIKNYISKRPQMFI